MLLQIINYSGWNAFFSVNDLEEVVLHIKLDSWKYKKAELTFYNVGSRFYQTEEGIIIENLDLEAFKD